MSFYVYIHNRPDTGKPFYVGKGKGNRFKDRSQRSIHWNNLVKKNGFIPIIVEHYATEQDALDGEANLIRYLRTRGYDLVNKTDGGNGMQGFSHSQEAKRKIAVGLTGRYVSKETRERIAQSNLGKPKTAEHRLKCSIAKTGVKRKPITEETRKRMSIASKGRKWTAEGRNNGSIAAKLLWQKKKGLSVGASAFK